MIPRPLLGLLLAASLAGCAGAPPITGTTPAAGPSATAIQASEAAAIALTSSLNMAAYGTMADDLPGPASYVVQAKPILTSDVLAQIKAGVLARRAALKAKLAARLTRMAFGAGRLLAAWTQASWTDDANGAKTKSITFTDTQSLNGQSWNRAVTMSRTVDPASSLLVASKTEIRETTPDGTTRDVTRSASLNADGSETANFQVTLTGTTTGTLAWTEMIVAGTTAGNATFGGAGDLVVDGKTLNVTLSGTQGAEMVTATTNTNETVTVTAPADGAPSATVNLPDGSTAPVPVSDPDAGASSSDVNASGTAMASSTSGT